MLTTIFDEHFELKKREAAHEAAHQLISFDSSEVDANIDCPEMWVWVTILLLEYSTPLDGESRWKARRSNAFATILSLHEACHDIPSNETRILNVHFAQHPFSLYR